MVLHKKIPSNLLLIIVKAQQILIIVKVIKRIEQINCKKDLNQQKISIQTSTLVHTLYTLDFRVLWKDSDSIRVLYTNTYM